MTKACLLFFLLPLSAFAGNLPPGFAELLVAQNLDPTAMALAPDGRVFITEKHGKVLIVENGQLLPDPFLIIEVDNYNERGLSGIAFDPDFAENGFIYLYYTVKNENHNRVSRFTANGNYAVPGSEMVLLNINQLLNTIHNAGAMAFGIDGKLYISVGDGGDGQKAQNLGSLLGKILRINADGTIPDDNPFYNNTTGIYRAIYARGFRNSFSFTIQPGTGRIFATEVGGGAWEEVNEITAGMNYGWPIIEGPISGQTPPENYKDPIYKYNHNYGCAIVGAAFYNPSSNLFPQLYQGKFFFADYCQGYIKYLDPAAPGSSNPFATNINRPLNLLVAPDGTMYYLARAGLGGGSEEDNTATNNGTLWRIFYTGSGKPFISANPQSLLVSAGEDARFAMASSGTQPIQYQWQQNGIDIPGVNASEYIHQNAMLSDSGDLFRCIVSNIDGADTSLQAELRVTSNQRPNADIITPVEGTTYRAGDILFFSGFAFDEEQGELDSSAFRWKIDFHHNVHTHPALVPTYSITEGEFAIPQTGETADDVWYNIHLSVTDSIGLTRTVSREVFPIKTQFNVHTIPSGLPVYVESDFIETPVSVTSVVGMTRRVEAIASVNESDSIWLFREWTDGMTDLTRTFTAEDDTVTFTALYESHPWGTGTGVKGYYYDGVGEDPVFYDPYKFTRIDTFIDFDWEGGSPSVSQLGNDFWLVRWEGFIEPLFDDAYDFHVLADDGIRLWVDDQMLIDAWIPQGPTEWTGSIDLEGGKLYPIKLEFYEEAGGAVCRLLWSSNRIAKSVVPRTQLYPEINTSTRPVAGENNAISIYPNPVGNFLLVNNNAEGNALKEITIQNALGQVLLYQTKGLDEKQVHISTADLPKGIFWLKYVMMDGQMAVLQFVKM